MMSRPMVKNEFAAPAPLAKASQRSKVEFRKN